MADNPRIEELRRRVQRDPASIAFAQLAEEYRRSGRFAEAIESSRAGLARHPGYVSARVTLGRALIEVGGLDEALLELTQVLRVAPENLAALRGLAEVHHRRGELPKALEYYKSALELARHDPDLEQIVSEIQSQIEPARRTPAVPGGLTFEQVRDELISAGSAPPPATPSPPPVPPPTEAVPGEAVPAEATPAPADASTESAPAGAEIAAARAQFAELQRWLDVLATDRPPDDQPH